MTLGNHLARLSERGSSRRARRLVRSKPTASGRVTRGASSDPACIFANIDQSPCGMTEIHESPLPSFRESPLPIDGDSLALHKAHAPNGGYLT
jgi:hypothetical protein